VWSPKSSCRCVRVLSLVRRPWRTFNCRYEHESQTSLRQVLPPVSLQRYRSDGGDGDETDSRPGWWARRASRHGRGMCSGRRSRWLSSGDQESFSTTSKGLGELASFLSDAAVDTVVMEATGVYCKPVYYTLEGLFEELWLCNAQHVKNVPGRKSDLSDAEWLATSLHTVWCGHPLSHRRRSESSLS